MQLSEGEYYGKVVQSVDLDGLVISKSFYSHGTMLPVHYHENHYFCFVLSGNYSERSSNKEIICAKGDLIFHPKNSEHHNNFTDSSTTCFNLEFSTAWISKFTETKIELNSIIKTEDQKVQNSVLKIYRELNSHDDHSSLMIEGLMLETIAGFFRVNSSQSNIPIYLKRVIEYLNDEFSSNPTLLHLSKIAGVSPEHLAREFKSKMKITIGEFHRQIKVKHCCYMLRHTHKNLSDIAFETGFSDQSHFCRVFKSLTGFSPLQYRLAK